VKDPINIIRYSTYSAKNEDYFQAMKIFLYKFFHYAMGILRKYGTLFYQNYCANLILVTSKFQNF